MQNIFKRVGFNYMRSKGRAVLHREIVPKFANFFENGNKIVEVGKHIFWDYKPFFFNPRRLCNFVSIDTKEGLCDQQTNKPLDYKIDNICKSKMEDNSVNGFLFIGMHDNISDPETAYEEMHRILKPGGRILIAFPGSGAKCGGRLVNEGEWKKYIPMFIIDEVHYVYAPENQERYTDERNTSILIIARKPYENN